MNVASPDPPLAARLVLADAREATARYKRRLDDGSSGRIDWIAAVTLLRPVGHVLDKVDGQKEPAKSVIGAAWDRWKQPRDPIFWDFIEAERNNVVKEDELGVYAPAYWLAETEYFERKARDTSCVKSRTRIGSTRPAHQASLGSVHHATSRLNASFRWALSVPATPAPRE